MMSLNLLCPVVCVVAKYEFNKDDKVTFFITHFFFISELAEKKSRHQEIVACSVSELYADSAFLPKEVARLDVVIKKMQMSEDFSS